MMRHFESWLRAGRPRNCSTIPCRRPYLFCAPSTLPFN